MIILTAEKKAKKKRSIFGRKWSGDPNSIYQLYSSGSFYDTLESWA